MPKLNFLHLEVVGVTTYVPERGLLAGILERAYRDLGDDIEKEERRSAIKWILDKRDFHPDFFTFNYVVSCLDLTDREIWFIRRKAIEALCRKSTISG